MEKKNGLTECSLVFSSSCSCPSSSYPSPYKKKSNAFLATATSEENNLMAELNSFVGYSFAISTLRERENHALFTQKWNIVGSGGYLRAFKSPSTVSGGCSLKTFTQPFICEKKKCARKKAWIWVHAKYPKVRNESNEFCQNGVFPKGRTPLPLWCGRKRQEIICSAHHSQRTWLPSNQVFVK